MQLIAREEFELCERLEKMKNRTIRNEKQKKRFSNTLNRIRTSLRISFNKGHNSVVPQDSFKETEAKSNTTNSITETAHPKTKKKVLINPMITILFLGMCFKAWKSFTVKKQENLLLSNDSLPIIKNDSSEEEWDEEQEQSDEGMDEFDESEQKEFEGKAQKTRRVGFANFGEIKEEEEEEENGEESKSEEEEESEGSQEEEQDKQKERMLEKKMSLREQALNEKHSILKSTRFSGVSPMFEEKRGSMFSGSPLLEKRGSKIEEKRGSKFSMQRNDEEKRGSKFGMMFTPKNDERKSLKNTLKMELGDSKSESEESEESQ